MSFLQHVATLRGSLQWPPAGKDRARVHLAAKSAADFLISAEVLPQLEPRQLALTAWSLARLAATTGWDTDEVCGPRSTLTESLGQRLEEFGPHELSMMLWAFAAGPAGKASQSGCGTFLEGKLGEASFMSISNSLWACTTLRVHPALPGLCMAAATRTATADISELSPQSLSNVAWALALSAPSVLSDSDGQRTAFDRAMILGWIFVTVTLPYRRAVKQVGTGEFRPAELVALSWALATSQAADSWLPRDATEQRRDVALSAVEATLANTPNSRQGVRLLAQAAWACANFPTAALSKPLWSRLAEALQVGLQGGCRSTSSQDLANGIWALAVASVAHADSSSFSALAGEAAKRDFEPRQLAACVSPAWLASAGARTGVVGIPSYSAQQAWALASSRHRDPAWLKALERSSLRVIEELQLSEVAAISWAWAASEAGESLIEALLPRAQQLLEGTSPRTSRGGPGFVEALLQLAWAGSFGQVSRASGLNKLIQDCLLREGRLRDSQTRGRMAEPASMLVEEVPTHSSNSPTIVVNEEQQGFVVLHKPVHWEVDSADGVGSASRPIPLSGYMQIQFPNRPLLSDASAGGGFLGRLDAQSSGLVISALTYEAHLLLQFRQDTHSVAREYVALCHGLVPEDLQEIRLPIRVRAGASSEVHASGVAAVTRLRVLARLSRSCSSSTEDYSLVVLSILTGRKHQIRCHLSHVGHPVVCDGRYAPQALQSDLQWCPRLFLHRFRLEFPGLDDCTIEASHGLPSDLQNVLRRLHPQSRTRMSEDVLSLWSRGDSLPFHEWAARSNARAQKVFCVWSHPYLFSNI
eukprot:s1388_g2.t2